MTAPVQGLSTSSSAQVMPGDVPGTDNRQGPLRTVIKVFLWLGALIYVGVYVPLVGLLLVASGTLGVDRGWVTGIVVVSVPVAVIAGGLLLSGTRVWLGGVFAAGAGTLAVVAGVLVAAWSAPQPPLIRAELDEVGVPVRVGAGRQAAADGRPGTWRWTPTRRLHLPL